MRAAAPATCISPPGFSRPSNDVYHAVATCDGHDLHSFPGQVLVVSEIPNMQFAITRLFFFSSLCPTPPCGWPRLPCLPVFLRDSKMHTGKLNLPETWQTELRSSPKPTHSVRDRDAEIVRIRHRQQTSQSGLSALAAAAAAFNGANGPSNSTNPGSSIAVASPAVASAPAANGGGSAATAVVAAAGGDAVGGGPGAFMTPSPRGAISRGEQAGQAVLARLARLEAGGTPGGVGTGGGEGFGVGGGGGSGPLNGPAQALTAQQLQVQVRRYQQALLAVGVGVDGGGGGGRGASGGGRPCVQVAQ